MHRLAVLLTLATLFAGHAQRPPRHVALLIGISDYQALTDKPEPYINGGLTDLEGPANDLRRMRASLLQWGFTDSADIRALTDRAATRAGIAASFRWIRDRATDPSDVVVVYFSGHGTSVADQNRDEADGKDEAIVPFDAANFTTPAHVVTDDSLGVWLAALATRNVTVIVDACFSGSVTRGGPSARSRGLPASVTGDIGDAVLERGAAQLGHTLITASRSFETAQEIEFPRNSNNWNGALTYHLTRLLDGASAAKGLRYDELVGALRHALAGEGLPQVPQIEGDSTSPLFRSHVGVASRAFAFVGSQSGNVVTLGVGAIHGVRASAVYDVYGANETRFAGGHLTRIKVESVQDTVSRARIVDDSGQPTPNAPRLPPGARAVPSLVPIGASDLPRLRVFIAATARDEFARAIPRIDTSLVDITRDSARAHAIVTRQRGVLEIFADGVALPPQIDGPPPPSVVVQGETVMGYTDATLCGALTRAFTIAKLATLTNAAAPAELRAHVRVVRAGASPPFDTTTLADTVMLGTSASPARIDIYARVSVPQAAAARSRFYVSAAVTGFVSDPYVFWPPRQEERFPPNQWRALWTGVAITPPTGREMIKLTVNSDQYDLRSLVNAATLCRSSASATEPARGPGATADSVAGWTTVSRVVHILPRR